MEIKSYNNLYDCHFTGLPDFFDFIEADAGKVFGKKGIAIIFNVLQKDNLNGKMNLGIILQVIKNFLARYPKIYGFGLGSNDFIITMPEYSFKEAELIANEIESVIKADRTNLDAKSVRNSYELNKMTLEYSKKIKSVEDFYELLFDSSILDLDKNGDSKSVVRHVVSTFTKNIRNTLVSYKYTNNLALTDDVSGLQNHRAGKIYLSNLVQEYVSDKKGIGILFIDGDNLKRYNDISYEAGNEMIRKLGFIISNSIRIEDKVFRWLSGDEFLVVLNSIDEKNTLKLAERIRRSVELQTKGLIYPTTISIGVSHFPNDGNSIDEIINKSARANSYAKIIGKNKVIKWDSSLEN